MCLNRLWSEGCKGYSIDPQMLRFFSVDTSVLENRNLGSTTSQHVMLPSTSSIQIRSNSTSSSSNRPTARSRRRRRSSNVAIDGPSEEEADTQPTKDVVNSISIFEPAVTSFLSQLEKGLEPMKSVNDIFHVTRDTNEQGDYLVISLRPGEGKYTIQSDYNVCTLSLISPMSGTYTYVLCGKTNKFVGMDDGHDMIGMLVRDLIKQCNGLPQF